MLHPWATLVSSALPLVHSAGDFITRKEFNGLRSELQKLTTMSTYETVHNEQAVGQDLLQNSTLHPLEHVGPGRPPFALPDV